MVTKSLHLRAIDKGTSIYHRLHGRIDLTTQTFILLPQIYHLYLFLKHLLRGDNGQLSIEILGGENHALGNNTFQLTGS